MTILDYLNHVRIRHATTCFYYYDVPISVIAQHVGFITPIHFTRVFKKLVGVSPSAFRSYYCLRNIDVSEKKRLTMPYLSTYEEILGEKDGFFKCHRSYIINLFHIDSYTQKEIKMHSGARIPISRNSHKDFEAAYFNLYFRRAGEVR